MSQQDGSVIKTAFVPEKDTVDSPRGEGEWPVHPGDCMSSIADETGHFWQTLWELKENQRVKDARKDPYVLLPGDNVYVPHIRTKDEECATDKRHRFRRRGVPEKLKIRLLDGEEPRAGEPYMLVIGDDEIEGMTDADGRLEEWIPPSAKSATLLLYDTEFELDLGRLDPSNTMSGAAARLVNLGFLSEDDTGEEDLVRVALGSFQLNKNLPVTHALNAATAAALDEQYTQWQETSGGR